MFVYNNGIQAKKSIHLKLQNKKIVNLNAQLSHNVYCKIFQKKNLLPFFRSSYATQEFLV